MATISTQWDYDLYGGAGNDTLTGGAGNERIFGGAGSDVLDGGGGSDDLKAGSGDDRLIYELAANAGASDVYTGGSGIDTIVLRLTQAQWQDATVRAELQRYVAFLGSVKLSAQGEVSNGLESDFSFQFGAGAGTLTVQMTEKLAVEVEDSPGHFSPVNYLTALILGAAPTAAVTEAGGVANGAAGVPNASGDLFADDLDGPDDLFQVVAAGTASGQGYGTYGVTSAGVWTYVLNDANAAVQGLNAGATLTDTILVTTADGGTQQVTITINGTNDTPVVTGSGTLAFTENQAAAAVLPTLAITDVDSAQLTGAAVSISGNFQSGQDVLGFTNQSGITGSYDAATGVLTLAGTASLADYQAALRSVTYANTSDDPATATRTVSFRVNDGSALYNLSNVATATVTVSAVNDAPTTSAVTLAAIAEDSGARLITQAQLLANATDVESDALVASALAIASGSGTLVNNGDGS
ncbi:VCBS domain-containing protein, partial [Ramlibacter sp.]|uniref:VCBS domain-containing protein n=1 Tax=Ramlibacter sp. TaxID=1917967 RepID=UPI002B7920FB